MALGYMLATIAIVIFADNCWMWFSSGVWTPATFSRLLNLIGAQHPYFESPSVQYIVEIILNVPIFGILGLAGLILMPKKLA